MQMIFIDIDNTLLDFDAYIRQTMREGFAHFGLKSYEPYMEAVFHRENGKLWRQIEEGTLTFPELEKIRWNNVFAALDKSYVDACAGHETAYLTFIAGRAGEYRVLEPGLLRAGLGAAFYKDDGSGRAEALNEMLHELVADGTVAAILESYGVDAQAALAGLIHGQ